MGRLSMHASSSANMHEGQSIDYHPVALSPCVQDAQGSPEAQAGACAPSASEQDAEAGEGEDKGGQAPMSKRAMKKLAKQAR